MRRTAEQYFRKFGREFTFPDVPGERSRLNPVERKSRGEEKDSSKITRREKNIPENLTATYWG